MTKRVISTIMYRMLRISNQHYKHITHVLDDSPADYAGFKAGDIVVSVNGEPLIDFIDEQYYNQQEYLEVGIIRDGDTMTIVVDKDEDEDIGIELKEDLYPADMHCRNRCVFCFVDQLPKGMRESLYIKDDDWRYSVLFGNFVTLTNLDDEDIDRIIARGASPLYLSVHATDPDVRVRMMSNPNAGRIMDQLKKLTAGGIMLNCQAVICPGYNDGAILDKTIKDLSSLYPMVRNLAIVPVGLTKHRKHLAELKQVDEPIAKGIVEQVEAHAKRLEKEIEDRFVYLSDEFYSRAALPYPSYPEGGHNEQISNGVGLFYEFTQGFEEALEDLHHTMEAPKHVLLITGTSASTEFQRLAEKLMSRVKNLKIEVLTVVNQFFGSSVTVAGLLTGHDIKDAVGDRKADAICVPGTALKDREDIFLDNMTILDLEQSLGIPIRISPTDGYDFVHALTDG